MNINRPRPDLLGYFDNRVGIYQCKKSGCLTCQFIEQGQSTFLHNFNSNICQFITCSSEFVIYILQCPCNLLYVGRTRCTLRKRIGEHRRFIQKGCTKHSVPQHFSQHHNKNISDLRVFAIEFMPTHLTNNEKFLRLCKGNILDS